MKTAEAMSSCSPPGRPWVAWLAGKAGERIQISSGTVAMRLIVMELGRFMGLGLQRRAARRTTACASRFGVSFSKTDGSSPQTADNSILSYPRTAVRVQRRMAGAVGGNASSGGRKRVPFRAERALCVSCIALCAW